jgi:hypothetical protein
MPIFTAPSYISDHRSPLHQRWGGWYVTGTHGDQKHMGNSYLEDKEDAKLDTSAGGNLTDLKRMFDTGAYLSPHSDIVALMVLEHQTRMTNLITRAGYEARIAGQDFTRLDEAVTALVNYMLFLDEAQLTAPVKGTSSFAADFVKAGNRDKRGRSLRDLDLTRRIFRYPCSFLIDSEAFRSLPQPALDRIYSRLGGILTGKDQSPEYARLTADDRRAIREILSDTRPDLRPIFAAENSR